MMKAGKHARRGIGARIGLFLIVVAAIFGAVRFFGVGPDTDRGNWPAAFRDNGERIYFTGTSSSGNPITLTGGGMGMGMRMGGSMRISGCVSCHGADRQGGRLMPRFWLVAPPLTNAALFKEHDETSGSDGHGDHEGYTDETLRRAITKGLDPDGKPLDPAMPRWSMATQDFADLVKFLKSPVR